MVDIGDGLSAGCMEYESSWVDGFGSRDREVVRKEESVEAVWKLEVQIM